MAEPTSCCTLPGSYWARIDVLFNSEGVRVIDVGWRGDQPLLTIETHPELAGWLGCGVVAGSHGRRLRGCTTSPRSGLRSSWPGGSAGSGAPRP